MGFESFLNEGKVFTEVTDEGRAFQTVGAARLKALSARIVLEEGTANRRQNGVCVQVCTNIRRHDVLANDVNNV